MARGPCTKRAGLRGAILLAMPLLYFVIVIAPRETFRRMLPDWVMSAHELLLPLVFRDYVF